MAKAVVRPLLLPPGRRVLIVSDIHGNLPFLKGLLAKAGFGGEDILVVLGDILERGEHNLETLQYVMELGKNYTVYTLFGNCDHLVNVFLQGGDISDDFYAWWFSKWGKRSVLVEMAELAGVEIKSPRDYPAARKAILKKFPEEAAFLKGLPHILVNDDYLLVHGGVPREEGLEELDGYRCLKNDDFWNQGYSFRRWVIVGHWPVTLYRESIQSAAPLLDRERHIASIDGGCVLKADGQLNALILPEEPGGEFSWLYYDGLPEVTALDSQEPSEDPVNIRYKHSELEVLEEGPEFCRCRHVETGRVLDVLTDYLFRDGEKVWCEDSTDYLLPVMAGDVLGVVKRTSRGALCKKDGVTGWYLGRLGPEK